MVVAVGTTPSPVTVTELTVPVSIIPLYFLTLALTATVFPTSTPSCALDE